MKLRKIFGFPDDENATGVTGGEPVPEAAKTAENETAGGAPGLAPTSSIESSSETNVPAQDLEKHFGLEPGDPVKVWADPEHKAFRIGEIVAVHEDGHAFDVELDDGAVTKVPADGLEYDDRS